MGMLSSKTRLHAGVSNSRMYKNNEFPRALKDSTAAYIKDVPEMSNPSEIAIPDYNNMGIEESIVPKFRKAARYVQKDYYKDKSGYKTSAIRIGKPEKIKAAIEEEMKEEFGDSLIINYMLVEDIDYAHLVRQFLIDDYQYSPISNSLVIEGQDYWLADAKLFLNQEQDTDPVGYSFTAPEVPNRDWDTTRPYTEWEYRSDIEKVPGYNPRTGTVEQVYPREYYDFQEKVELSLIEKYTHKFYEVHDVITTIDALGEETIETTEPIITDIYNNLPTSITVHEFRSVLEEETSVLIEDTPERRVVRITKKYDSSYYPQTLIKGEHTVMLSDYFIEPPSIPEMGEWHEGDDDQNVEDYIEDFENNTDVSDIFSSTYIISISFSYENSDGNRVETYRTLVDTRKEDSNYGDIYQRYDDIIWDNIELLDVGFYMPELFYRQFAEDITKTNKTKQYDIYSKYSKKLGIKYNGFIDKLYDSMIEEAEENDEDVHKVKDNWSKVRSVCLVFGIPIDTEDNFLSKYLFEFFNIHVPTVFEEGESTGKAITVEDDWSTDKYFWDESSREVIEMSIIPEGELFKEDTYYSNKSELEYIDIDNLNLTLIRTHSLYKQISSTKCEVIKIIGYRRDIRVTDKKWISGNSKEDEEADTLVPISPALLLKHYRSFKDKEAAIYKSMYVEFISYVKVKDKWYQGGLGQLVGFAIGAIVTIIYPPAILAGMALSTAATIVVSSLIGFAINQGISLVLKLVVSAFGLENSRVLAILAAIGAIAFGAYSSMGNIGTLIKSFQLFFNKITVYMIQAAKGLFNEVNVLIGVELEEEAKSNREKIKELETQAENMFSYLINDSGDYNVNRNYISPMINLGMGIDQIMAEATNYNRMTECIEYSHNYADYIIALPTLDETIQSMQQSKQQ